MSVHAEAMAMVGAAASAVAGRSLQVGARRRSRKIVEAKPKWSNNVLAALITRRLSHEPVSGGHHHCRRTAVAVASTSQGSSQADTSRASNWTLEDSFFSAGDNDGGGNNVRGFYNSGGGSTSSGKHSSIGFTDTTSTSIDGTHVHVHLDAQYKTPTHRLNGGIGGRGLLGLVGPGGTHTCVLPLTVPAGATVPDPHHCHSSQRARRMSSWTGILPSVPEFAQHWTVWGGSGIILKTIHNDGAVPYWACMAITNILVRSTLVPLVIQSAHTSSRFAKVAPEVQFLLTIFQKDIKGLRERNESPVAQFLVMKATWQTLGALYKVHKIHPFAVFRAPLMQIPVFWYFSIDLRKIINGADPGLAQSLTEGGLLWVKDLTEPDPWYGLPILGGLLLYANVEVALGKKILSGEATSKANVAVTLKDFFQSLAVFMPCFMAHQPAGVQIYLATSFVFTMFQSSALRNDSMRALIGLPKMEAQQKVGAVTKEFMDIKEFENEAREARGQGELLGEHGVLQPGWESSVPGTSRPSTITGSAREKRRAYSIESDKAQEELSSPGSSSLLKFRSPSLEVPGDSIAITGTGSSSVGCGILTNLPQDGSSVVDANVVSRKAVTQKPEHGADYGEFMPFVAESDIEAANRGELPQKPVMFAKPEDRSDKDSILSLGKIAKKKRKRKGRKKK